MKAAAEIFGKFIFWGENLVVVALMGSYEALLLPIIFVRVVINILRSASILRFFGLFLGWLSFGTAALVGAAMRDMFYILKILCDYQDEDDSAFEKREAELRQDKSVLYNEVLDVARSLYHILKGINREKRRQHLRKQRECNYAEKQIYSP